MNPLEVKYKTGDIIYWKGNGPALIRILTVNPHNNAGHNSIDPTATNQYNSLHLSNVRHASEAEIKLLGQEDFMLYKAAALTSVPTATPDMIEDDILKYLKEKFGI